MTLLRLLQSFSLGILIFTFAACSGGEGQEPIEPQAVNTPEPTPPAEPPAPEPPAPEPPPTTPPPVVTPPPTVPPPTVPPPTTKPPIIPKPLPPPVVEPTMPTGIWQGNTLRDGRTVLGIIKNDGSTWLFISVVGSIDWLGGIINGTMTTDGSTWKMENALFIDKMYGVRARLDADGTWLHEQRVAGRLEIQYDPPTRGTPPYESDGIDLIYNSRSKTAYSASQAAGTYRGLWIPVEEVELTLARDGKIRGVSATSCEFTGQATPAGFVANVVITYVGPPCAHGHATVRGVLTVSPSGTLHVAGLSSDKNQDFMMIGQR